MLDEAFEPSAEWRENEDCGCWVVSIQIDGQTVEAHHWIPDDTAPHVPDGDCGCKPALRAEAEGVVLFEHWDQDDPLSLRGPVILGEDDEPSPDDRRVDPAGRLDPGLAGHVDDRVP